jgi:hypothetical protein
MPHLHLVSDNRGIAQPFRTRRDREARRTELGIVGHDGGRAPRRPTLSVYEQTRNAQRPAPAVDHDYVDLPCDV